MSTVARLTADERETVITTSDGSPVVRIWTAQRTVLTALRRKPHHFTEVRSGFHGATEWAEFETVTDVWNVATGAKRKGTPRPGLSSLRWSSVTVLPERAGHASIGATA
jgi:hypothetical protein